MIRDPHQFELIDSTFMTFRCVKCSVIGHLKHSYPDINIVTIPDYLIHVVFTSKYCCDKVIMAMVNDGLLPGSSHIYGSQFNCSDYLLRSVLDS